MKKVLLLTLMVLSPVFADLSSDVDSVLPKTHESRWSNVPWAVDLNRARSRSQDSGKPLFCWVMDGHVLAAT